MSKLIYRIAAITLALFFGTAPAESAGPKLPDSYSFNRGREEYFSGNAEDALEWFNKEVSENPGNGYAYFYISIIRLGNAELGQALTAVNTAIKKLPKKDKEYSSLAYAYRGEIYLELEDTVRALNDYAQAIKINPSNKNYYMSRAQIYYEQGKYSLSDADYRKMIELDEGDEVSYVGLGRNAKEMGNWDEAIKHFNHAERLASDNSHIYTHRADTYMRMQKWNEAIDDILMALSIDNDNFAWHLLTQIDKDQAPTLKAKIKVKSLKEPNEGHWPFILGYYYYNNGMFEEAIPQYEAAFKLLGYATIYEYIADCYEELGELDNAMSAIDRALQINPDRKLNYLNKADLCFDMGDYTNAIANADIYVESYPDFYFGYYRRGWYKNEAKDFDGALDDYTMSIVLDPNFAYAYNGRGQLYQRQGKEDRARADFEKVIELDTIPLPGESCAQFAYFRLGRTDKAIEFMDSIIAKGENDKGVYYDAACLYSLIGNKDKAIDYLRKAYELGYRKVAHTMADYDLDNIKDMPEFIELIEQYSKPEPTVITNTIIDVVRDTEPEVSEIPFTKEGGVTKVKCSINDLPLYFVFDTGAADVTISMVEANFMMKNQYIKPTDVIGSARYVDANGDISEGTIINLRKVNFGGLELENVRASVVRNQKAPLLLGQSVLGRLGRVEIDNEKQMVKITR